MMTQRLFRAVFAIFILTFSHCFGDEENQGLDTPTLGPEWAVEEIKFSEMRETVYSVRTGSPDMEFQEKHVEEPYEITRLELRKAVGGDMETVWTGESAFPKSCGPVFSGVTPHDGIVVWSVAESGGDVLVLCSVNTRLRVDVQRKDSDGRWQTVRTHPLGYIDSIHFEGKLIVGNDTINVETTQWDDDNSKCGKGQTRRYAITQDGMREYSPNVLSTPGEYSPNCWRSSRRLLLPSAEWGNWVPWRGRRGTKERRVGERGNRGKNGERGFFEHTFRKFLRSG